MESRTGGTKIRTDRINGIEKKVFSYMEKHNMIVPGDKIVIGVSGGADSVCLLFLLLEYAKKVPITLGVAHVNHGLRADAGEDARYVESLCREQGVPFFLTGVDVREFAAREKCSEEDAGRRLRYQAFYQAAERLGGAKLAVAHNSGDNAETMLFHLFRGSGLKGLCGIAPVRGEVIRPILCLERREVEDYLRERGIGWRTDSTNGEDHYRRNRIRHHILPYAEAEVAQGAVEHMCRTAELLSETEDYLERQTLEALAQCVVSGEEGRYEVEISRFMPLHVILRKRVLFALAGRLSPTGKDISTVHVEEVMALFEGQGNRTVSLPFQIIARRRYGTVILERAGQRTEPADEEAVEIRLPDLERGALTEVKLGDGRSMEFELFFPRKGQKVPKNQYTKWFDYDKIKEWPAIRFRRTGDFLTIADRKGGLVHKSLKDYMITEKIPRELRGTIPLLAMGSHVLWLAGYRISEYFKVGENTNRILQVKLKEGCVGGETEEKNVGAY